MDFEWISKQETVDFGGKWIFYWICVSGFFWKRIFGSGFFFEVDFLELDFLC